MVLAIKLRDNIFVPQVIIENVKHIFGENYITAQNAIKGIYPTIDESSFEGLFFNKISNHFKPTIIFNLYHLVDSQKISNGLMADKSFNDSLLASNPNPNSPLLKPLTNYLNLFGFEIKQHPNVLALGILNGLKIAGIIQEFWLEGETFQSNNFQNQNTLRGVKNEYLKNLKYLDISNRGSGASIVIIESDATDDLQKISEQVNIENFINGTISLNRIGDMRFGSTHQLQTLTTLYGSKTGTLEGLTPKANLVIGSLNKTSDDDKLLKRFKSKKNYLLNLLRSILIECDSEKFQNAILLLEFETWIPMNSNKPDLGEIFPSYIIWDVKKQLEILAEKRNIIVVGGVGNSHKNFDSLNPSPSKNAKGYKYVDLNEKGLPFIMVGGTDKKNENEDFTISKDSNYGKNVDVYMYTDFNLGRSINFQGTSGASAAVAGVVTFLQGKALSVISLLPGNPTFQNVKPLTTQIIRKVFEKTFMSKFPKTNQVELTAATTGIINHTSLIDLWIECQKELAIQPSQHQ